jgi:hypothetical protein
MASSISVEGMAPASLSLVAFTITITRIALSPLLVEAAPAPYPDDERAAPGSTSRRTFFFARSGSSTSGSTCVSRPLTVAQKPHRNGLRRHGGTGGDIVGWSHDALDR